LAVLTYMSTPLSEQVRYNIKEESREVLSVRPPFNNCILELVDIDQSAFPSFESRALGYPNDSRLIDMVRAGGDASAKVPYLMSDTETPESILDQLKKIAQPHVEHISTLPEDMQSTITLLLTINAPPTGKDYRKLVIPALLELDRIQGEMTSKLHTLMEGRTLARVFHEGNIRALQQLDSRWPSIRENPINPFSQERFPMEAKTRYIPEVSNGKLAHIREESVIVNPPFIKALQFLTPDVLKRPLPQNVKYHIGSIEWLIREIGKVGRHSTRALLDIVKERIEQERIDLSPENYANIAKRGMQALQEHIENTG
jgi:hypothetical protein